MQLRPEVDIALLRERVQWQTSKEVARVSQDSEVTMVFFLSQLFVVLAGEQLFIFVRVRRGVFFCGRMKLAGLILFLQMVRDCRSEHLRFLVEAYSTNIAHELVFLLLCFFCRPITISLFV